MNKNLIQVIILFLAFIFVGGIIPRSELINEDM